MIRICAERWLLLFMSFLCIASERANFGEANEQPSNPATEKSIRNPRIFFPLTTSTSTVTYTASIWTVCYRTTNTAVTVCGKRKRRALEDMLGDSSLGIQPSNSAREWTQEQDDIEE